MEQEVKSDSYEWDIFISHRSTDGKFAKRLAEDINSHTYLGRPLKVWLDKWEIKPGQSIPGMISEGLEKSRYIAVLMTPEYFQSPSGYTDAEWHSALHVDPDNRQGRIIPILVKDCPRIPFLLRHLNMIDLRKAKDYKKELQQILAVLKNEPLSRPVTHRGQLISTMGKIDRRTLIAERSVIEADPDTVQEMLYCNLLPIERLPQYVYIAPIAKHLLREKRGGMAFPPKKEIMDFIREAQEDGTIESKFMPAFRLFEGNVVAFHDLESPDGPLSIVVDTSAVDIMSTLEFLKDPDGRMLIVSLLNMAIDRYLLRIGLRSDFHRGKRRFFFPGSGSEPIKVKWKPVKKRAERSIAKPYTDRDGNILYWLNRGAWLKVLFLANKFYLHIRPTWVITEDGVTVKRGPDVGRKVYKWTAPERNLAVLYNIRFWTWVFQDRQPGPISIRAGDRWIEISSRPAFVKQSYGIAEDQKNLMRMLEVQADTLAKEEDEVVNWATELEVTSELETVNGENHTLKDNSDA